MFGFFNKVLGLITLSQCCESISPNLSDLNQKAFNRTRRFLPHSNAADLVAGEWTEHPDREFTR